MTGGGVGVPTCVVVPEEMREEGLLAEGALGPVTFETGGDPVNFRKLFPPPLGFAKPGGVPLFSGGNDSPEDNDLEAAIFESSSKKK